MITWWQVGFICGDAARTYNPDETDGMMRGVARESDFLPPQWRSRYKLNARLEEIFPIPEHVIVAQRQAIKDYSAGFIAGRNPTNNYG